MRSAEENKLEKDLRRWFSKLQRKIQKLIDTYYEDELFFLHVNKVYTIVEDMKPEYQAILLKHGLTQFYNARETATTLYTIQQKKVSAKASLYEPQIIRQEDVGLFRTNPQIEDSLRYNTFQASDTTLARVSQNITNNLSDSYHEGLGINDAGRKITKEFSSLKGWESRRIARTEINTAQNEGAFSVYDELGVEYHMWWTGQDNRVRDSHAPLHGHIVAVGNTFSNGLLFPGDKSGPIKEWINCRCTSIPYIIPLGKMAPLGLTEFTEEQLIDIPGYTPITVEDALKGFIPDEDIELISSELAKHKLQTDNVGKMLKTDMDETGSKQLKNMDVDGFDKYALTEQETKLYKELKKLKETGSLRFLDKRALRDLSDRKEFNELRNKILLQGGDPNDVFSLTGAEGVRYERLFKQFKDWVPKGKIEVKPIEINKKDVFKKDESFKLDSREKTVFKELKNNKSSLNEKEKKYLFELTDKNSLNTLHKKLINEGLDDIDSKNYVTLYSEYKTKWDLPDLDINLKFTTEKKYYSREQTYKQAKEFKLTKKENEELYKLEKKELLGQKLSSQELKRKELLQAQDEFAYLNALNKKHGGLNYEDYTKFKKLYKQVKTNIKIDKRVLEQPLSNYKSEIPLDKNPKNLKKFKGTNEEGLLPNGEEIIDYFTKDARDMTVREQQVAHRWLGRDYKAFTNFEVDCDRDVKKFEKWIYDMAKAYEKDNSLKYYKYYYNECTNNQTIKISKSLAKKLARSIAHDVPVLDNILNNQLKQGITLWRVQEDHNLSSIVVGDIMDFPNFRAAAISKEGALWFSATNAKHMKYLIQIEAPTGTRGAFLAPIKQGTWHAPPEIGVSHPLHGQNYAREMEFLLKKCKVELIKFGGKPVKGAMGEDLIPIKLRVVGYK